jgi:ElaB/YqjD/DUF883 family membrane-anchored ribosome-binding protein
MATYDTLPEGAVPVQPQGTVRGPDPDVPTTGALPQGAIPVPLQPSVAPPEPTPTEPDFGERVTGIMKDRYDRMQRMRKEYMEDNISTSEYYGSRMATSMGAFFDVAGEGLLTVLSTVTPDRWERMFKEAIATGGNALMSTDVAKQLLEMYQGADQLTKDRLANTVDLAAGFGSQTKAASKLSPTDAVGRKLSASAVKSDKKKLSPIVLDQTSNARKQREAQAGMPVDKQNQINFDEDILNTVLSLPTITGATDPQTIIKKLNGEITRVDSQVTSALRRSPARIMRSTVDKKIDLKIAELLEEMPAFGTEKELKKIVKKVRSLANTSLAKHSGKPADLLQARRDLDKSIAITFGDKLFEGTGASRMVVSKIRKALNELAEDAVEDEDLATLMKRQHLLLEARDNAAHFKATKAEPKNVIQQTVSAVERHPYLTAGAIGIGERSGLLSGIPPEYLFAGATALAGYGATLPAVRRTAGEALQTLPVSTSIGYGAAPSAQEEPQQ